VSRHIPFTIPREPSIAGFVLLSYVIGIATSKNIDPIKTVSIGLIYLHLILTIDFIFYNPSPRRLKSLYSLVSNTSLFIFFSLMDGYESMVALLPTTILFVATMTSLVTLGRLNPTTLSTGTSMLTFLTLYTSASIGEYTLDSLEATILYTLYSVASVLYVESKVGRVDVYIPGAISTALFVGSFLFSPYYPFIFIDLAAKSITHVIRKEVIDVSDITSLGKKELLRILIHTPLIILASLA